MSAGGPSRRAPRTRPVVVALVVLAACAVAACAAAGGDPGEDLAGSVRPAAGEASEAPLVGVDDLPGLGWRRLPPAATPPGDERRWVAADCPWADPADQPAREHRQRVRRDAYRGPGGALVTVVVERFAGGRAADVLVSVRSVVRDCARYQTADFMESHTVTREGFAGDESLLIESVRTTPPAGSEVRRAAVVRRGDAIVTVIGVGLAAEPLTRVATTASHRL